MGEGAHTLDKMGREIKNHFILNIIFFSIIYNDAHFINKLGMYQFKSIYYKFKTRGIYKAHILT